MNKEVTVIIISHQSKDLVLNFIKNIYTKFEIIIIDNSNDYELTKNINQDYPGVLIKNIDNNGYGAAINYGSKFVKCDINNITKFLIFFKRKTLSLI